MEEIIKEKIYYMDIDKETNLINGFYIEEIHEKNIPEGTIKINEELWQHLLNTGKTEIDNAFFNSKHNMILNMDYAEMFKVKEYEPMEQTPSELDMLKNEVAELKELIMKQINLKNEV